MTGVPAAFATPIIALLKLIGVRTLSGVSLGLPSLSISELVPLLDKSVVASPLVRPAAVPVALLLKGPTLPFVTIFTVKVIVIVPPTASVCPVASRFLRVVGIPVNPS